MAGGIEMQIGRPPIGEDAERKQEQLSYWREVYMRFAMENGFTEESMNDINLTIENPTYPENFSGEIKGKKFRASRDSEGGYTVMINNQEVRDNFLAEQLYRRYYPVARLMSMEITSFIEPGMKDINELL